MNKHWRIGMWSLILLGGITVWAQDSWQIAGAGARFDVQITSRPAIPEAGIVAILPDGGILPKGKLKADVLDEAGKPLKANLLWHNPEEGLALVFEDSPAVRAWIYVSPSPDYPKASAPLRPSLMLFVHNGRNPGLDQAHALAAKMPVGPDVHFALVERIFHSISPVGQDENSSSYYSGWFDIKKAGKTYFYTVSKDGSEFSIDGKLVCGWPGLHNRTGGQYADKGAWIDLSVGNHRIEYFHFTQTAKGRECQLGWQQAGEAQPNEPTNPKLPNRRVTAPMEEYDFVHSGVAAPTAAYSRQGPLAIIAYRWEATLKPGQDPVCLIRFDAFGSDKLPTNTVYEWDFGGGRKLLGPQADWLYGGTGSQRVSLTMSGGNGKSTCSKLIFPKMLDSIGEPGWLSINSAEDRSKVRDLFLAMCRATPAGKRPCELWNATLWEGFMSAIDFHSDYALLSELFERSRADILRLDDTRRWLLEDIFYAALRQANPKLTVTWLNRFEKEEKTAARIGAWKARRVEFYIFEAGNIDQARLAANAFSGAAAGLQQTELAMIRMGDVDLFNGHPELAQRFYAQAQESRQSQAHPATPGAYIKPDDNQRTHNAAFSPRPGSKPVGAAEQSRGRQQAVKTIAPAGAAMDSGAPKTIDTWKVSAVRAAAFYSTVRSLIGQQAYFEARNTLDQWEMELPLDKLAGDFPLAEAEYYLALKQFKRAQKILMTYRQAVDLSNSLPQIMRMELYCLTMLDRDKEARELAAQIIKRLPNHPLAAEVKGMLAAAPADGKLAVDIDAWSQDWTASEKVDGAGLTKLFGIKEFKIKPAPAGTDDPEGAKTTDENPAE
ncbi:MAG: hypothetical protein PHW60_05020 [Kiritimatiellae bacterium]|nr:hypothetical protein [Kiritimatiellia bacterium]